MILSFPLGKHRYTVFFKESIDEKAGKNVARPIMYLFLEASTAVRLHMDVASYMFASCRVPMKQ